MSAPAGPHLAHLHHAARKHRDAAQQHADAHLAAVIKAYNAEHAAVIATQETPSPGK